MQRELSRDNAQTILKLLLAVGTLLEGRDDIAGALERVPSIALCVADNTREMGEVGAFTA